MSKLRMFLGLFLALESILFFIKVIYGYFDAFFTNWDELSKNNNVIVIVQVLILIIGLILISTSFYKIKKK